MGKELGPGAVLDDPRWVELPKAMKRG